MKLKLNSKVLEKIPGVQIGVLVLKNLNNNRKFTTVDQLLRGLCAQKKAEFKKDTRIKEINTMLQQARVDNNVMPEAQLLESNVRKIARGREIASHNNLYTLTHYLGVKYLVPIYAYDLDKVGEDLVINFVEAKQGKRPEDIDITPETVHSVIWFINIGSQTREDFQALPGEFVNLISKYCGGTEADVYILDADQKEVDLGYESELEKENIEKKANEPEVSAADDQDNESSDQSKVKADPDNPPFMKEESTKQAPKELTNREKVEEAVAEAVKSWLSKQESGESTNEKIEIETPNDPQHGDYSTNIALKLSKKMGKAPHEIADALIGEIKKPDFISKVDIAGPGFVNFYISDRYLIDLLNQITKLKKNYGRSAIGTGQKALVEYSSPNIAKPLAVHHLLSTIIGQTIADLFKFAGYETVTLNWPGDWGTQFGKLIYAYKIWGSEEAVKKDPLTELLNLYVKFHEEEEKDPSLVEKGREEFKKLEEGDDENNNLWEWFRDISIKELDKMYKNLGVSFDEYLGERMYLDDAKQILEEGKQKGIFVEGEKGAIIAEFENENIPPYMVQKADGTTLYSIRDLASLKDRIERLKGDKLVYVIDVAQKLHVQQLFETGKRFNWGDAELYHLAFGRMKLPEGKMSTRKGDIILLDEVIKEAVKRTSIMVAEKSKELEDDEKKHIADKMAIGAIKYNIISQNPETNITFEWDKMLSLEGNSGPYLQYAYARAKSILTKAKDEPIQQNIQFNNDRQTDLFSLTEQAESKDKEDEKPYSLPSEQALMHMLPRFPEVIEASVREYRPNLVTTYLFELARTFNSFYNEAPVITASSKELKEARLKLVEAFAQILQNGLNVLGIEVFERM